jgi:hypothetical protein
MYKNATKCNETIGKWCKNKHGASKIIDTFETYQSPSVVLSFFYWIDNLGFITEGKLAAIFIKPSLGVFNWSVIYYTFPRQLGNRSFLSPLSGIEEEAPTSSPRHQERRASSSPEGTGICGGTDLERTTTGEGKHGRGEEHGEEALGRAPLWSPVEQGPEVGGVAPLHVAFSVAKTRACRGFRSRRLDQWTDFPGKGVERPGSTSLIDNQMARWTIPGQFGPRFVRPGKGWGSPREPLHPNEPLLHHSCHDNPSQNCPTRRRSS